MITMSEVVPGDKLRLIDFGQTDPLYRRKLLSLGMICGVEFRVIRVAPLGCPLQVDIRGTSITLRKEEASCLKLERV